MNLLKELVEKIADKKKTEEKVSGTYVGARFSKETVKNLRKMMKDLKVPNPISSKKFHTTIIYSDGKTAPDSFEPLGKIDPPWEGTPTEFEIFPTQTGKNALVLRYKCKEQANRHKELMKKYDLNYGYDEYKIHLTLSYDCEDFSLDNINPKDHIDKIIIDTEYSEPLQLDWNKE